MSILNELAANRAVYVKNIQGEEPASACVNNGIKNHDGMLWEWQNDTFSAQMEDIGGYEVKGESSPTVPSTSPTVADSVGMREIITDLRYPEPSEVQHSSWGREDSLSGGEERDLRLGPQDMTG